MLERAGNKGLISEMRYREIKRAYPQILTLDEFLDLAITHQKSVMIETKHPVISGTLVEDKLIETLRDRKVLEAIPVSIMSFSWNAIEKVSRLAPEFHTTFLMSSKMVWPQVRFSSSTAIGPGIHLVRNQPLLISKIRGLGKEISVWTVDEGADVELCIASGIDNLITNKPAHVRGFL